MAFLFGEAPEDVANAMLDVVVSQYKGSGSICSRIKTTLISSSIIALLDVTGCRHLFPYVKYTSIGEILPKVPMNKIDELVLKCEIDTFDEISELIKSMQSNTHRVSHIRLWNSRNVVIANYHEAFLSAIKNNFNIAFISKPSLLRFFKKAKKSIDITRSTNSNVIKIYYSGREIHLSTKKIC